MTRNRLKYLWDYYKPQIIGALTALVLVIYFIVIFTRDTEIVDLNVSFINQYESVGVDSEFTRDFLAYAAAAGSSVTEETIRFDANYFFDLSDESDFTNNYFQKFVAKLENDEVDVIIGSRANILGIARGGRTLDLNDERTGDLLTKYSDALITYEDEDGTLIPVGLVLPEETPLSGYGEEEEVSIALSSTLLHDTEALLLLEYLMTPES